MLRLLTQFRDEKGAALVEFAVALPILTVFVVGIYDFSGAFDQKQKIEQAAQEGAILAGAQPTSDIDASNGNPLSLQPVATAVINSLSGSGILSQSCVLPAPTHASPSLQWTYTISGCSTTSDQLTITINRGFSAPVSQATGAAIVGTTVTVAYPYNWKFNSVIQLVFPGSTGFASPTTTETATVHNQT